MRTTLFMALVVIPLVCAFFAAVIYLFVLLVKALRKYISSGEMRKKKWPSAVPLGKP